MPLNTAVMFGKATDEWETPHDVFDALDAEFCLELDVAASDTNAKCSEYYTREHDALTKDWHAYGLHPPACWMNPPYSKCRAFIAKAADEARKGCLVVALVPSRTDTRWWHEHVWDSKHHRPRAHVEIRFIPGRLKFGNSNNSAPFPSVVIIFRRPA